MNYLTMNNAFIKTHNFHPESQLLSSENNNQITTTNNEKLQQIWCKYKFESSHTNGSETLTLNNKMSWAANDDQAEPVPPAPEEEKHEEVEVKVEDVEEEEEEKESSPSHHARRPMNAFLIFCKKHRPIVREKFPSLENRGVTKILGEWWALLDEKDKAPYTGLAKEYKDAFLSANPNFKWYKLPAPPLRTLHVRPTTLKVQSPVSSPTHQSESEFTPGKLADESQLGSLTSLMNNFTPQMKKPNENNNNNNDEEVAPVNLMETALPLKPFKKRTFDKYPDNNTNVARNIFNYNNISPNSDGSNMTNQDLMDKVVDKYFTTTTTEIKPEIEKDMTRKSGRQCKGKRYEKFMVEGRLLGNKRDTKLTSQRGGDIDKIENEFNFTKNEPETPNLDHTIKRLAERTNMTKSVVENQKDDNKTEISRNNNVEGQTNFNLNLRINNLPSLSYDIFHQRKRESKKRKNRIKVDDSKSKITKLNNNKTETQLVGSKKRKNKQSITHLKEENNIQGDLLALATLAEVAANTQKISD